MGCDIRALIERKVGDKWIMVNRLDGEATRRNYKRFSALAGVRGDGPDAKGLPDDISESGRLFADDCEGDAHSHSFLGAKEAADIFLATAHDPNNYAKSLPCSYFFGIEDNEDAHRIVFWFDN